MLHLENDGPDLRATNYWQTEHARRGVLRLPLTLPIAKARGFSVP